MKISVEEVKHVATLARLAFPEDELDAFTQQLNSILTYIEKLEELDTEGVEPTFHAVSLDTPYREDKIKDSPGPDVILANAPERDEDFFVVPRVI